jgi:hypothetical protein
MVLANTLISGAIEAIASQTHRPTDLGGQFLICHAGLEQVDGITMSDPLIAGNWITAVLTIDATAKGGGRVNLNEICVCQVLDGKIALEQFFYGIG